MTWLQLAPSTPPVVLAHRGDADHAPENTLAAFRAAVAAGARGVETDVQLSADGVPLLLHDDGPARTTDSLARGIPAETSIESLPWETLAGLDAGSWFDERFRGEPIP
ncbi:MAG: esterase, partial [Salana multivorans]|nr:esterase [Salana multivorans]